MGIKLVFVMEGEAPRLKADTMSKRNEMRYGPSKKIVAARTGRSLFKAILKEVSDWGLCSSIFHVIGRNLNQIKYKDLTELIVFYTTNFSSVLCFEGTHAFQTGPYSIC